MSELVQLSVAPVAPVLLVTQGTYVQAPYPSQVAPLSLQWLHRRPLLYRHYRSRNPRVFLYLSMFNGMSSHTTSGWPSCSSHEIVDVSAIRHLAQGN